jgi:hypothetical protein
VSVSLPTTVMMDVKAQCAALVNPILNCEAVLSGKMAPAPYEDNSKLDFGPSNPGTVNNHVLDASTGGGDTRSVAVINAQNDLARAEYGLRVELNQQLNEAETRLHNARRAMPYTGMR